MNSKSSVCFGLDESGLSKQSRSVTTKDYGKPADKDYAIALESYAKGGVSRKPDIPFFDPINIESEKRSDYTSVAQRDYKDPSHLRKGYAADDGAENKKYLRTHHFSFGEPDEDDVERRIRTTTHSHFLNPTSLKFDPSQDRKDAAGSFGPKTNVASRAQCDNYETTLRNTISRYPYDNSTFQTVSSKAYKTFDSVDRAQPFRPRGDLVGEYLHPMIAPGPARAPIRELTTVTRRSYLPPEVMKFCQPEVPVGVQTTVIHTA